MDRAAIGKNTLFPYSNSVGAYGWGVEMQVWIAMHVFRNGCALRVSRHSYECAESVKVVVCIAMGVYWGC